MRPAMKTVKILAKSDRATGAVIFLHGLGDTASGWSDVAQMLSRSLPSLNFILPTAPQRPVTINGGMKMPAWYDITDLSGRDADEMEGMEESRQTIYSLVREQIEAGVPSNRIIVGGFSQGAAVSLYSAYQFDQQLGGVIAMSGYLPMHRRWKEGLTECNKSTKALMCHGDADQVVALRWGQASHAVLTENGIDADFKVYENMPHSACPQEISDVQAFIAARMEIEPKL